MGWRAEALRRVIRVPGFARLLGTPPMRNGTRLDAQLHTLCVLERWFDWSIPRNAAQVARHRAETDALLEVLGPSADPSVGVRDISLDGPGGAIPARVFTPPSVERPAPALVYLHGGGWAVGSLRSHHGLCAMVAVETGAVVVSVAYRLAPEHPFPASWDDSLAAYRQIAERAPELGLDPARLVVGGDSAGGVMSLFVGRATRGDAVRPRALWLVYPAADFTRTYDSERELGVGFILTASRLDWYTRTVVADPADRADPRLSPLLADDLGDLPPTRLVLAGFDPLVDEGRALWRALEATDGSTELRVYDSLTHGFVSLVSASDACRRAVLEEVAALRRLWG